VPIRSPSKKKRERKGGAFLVGKENHEDALDTGKEKGNPSKREKKGRRKRRENVGESKVSKQSRQAYKHKPCRGREKKEQIGNSWKKKKEKASKFHRDERNAPRERGYSAK